MNENINSLIGEVFFDDVMNVDRKITNVKVQGSIILLETEIVEYYEVERGAVDEESEE